MGWQLPAIWAVRANQAIGKLRGHANWVSVSAMEPDSQLAVTGSLDNTAESGRPTRATIRVLEGHGDWLARPDVAAQMAGGFCSWQLDKHRCCLEGGRASGSPRCSCDDRAVLWSPGKPRRGRAIDRGARTQRLCGSERFACAPPSGAATRCFTRWPGARQRRAAVCAETARSASRRSISTGPSTCCPARWLGIWLSHGARRRLLLSGSENATARCTNVDERIRARIVGQHDGRVLQRRLASRPAPDRLGRPGRVGEDLGG